MGFELTKLVGLIAMAGTVAGLVLGGATIESNVFIGGAFFLLALVSFAVFVAFLYNFIKYAQYEMPYENVKDEMIEEKE